MPRQVPVTQRGRHWPAVVVILAFLTAMVNLIVAAGVASGKVDGHFPDLWSLIRASPATAAIYMCAFFVGCATVSLLFNALFSFEASTRRLAWCVAGLGVAMFVNYHGTGASLLSVAAIC